MNKNIGLEGIGIAQIPTTVQKGYRAARHWVEQKVAPSEKHLLDVYQTQELPQLDRLIGALKHQIHQEKSNLERYKKQHKPVSTVWRQPTILAVTAVGLGCAMGFVGSTLLNAVFLGPIGITFCLLGGVCAFAYVYGKNSSVHEKNSMMQQDVAYLNRMLVMTRSYVAKCEKEKQLILQEIERCDTKLKQVTLQRSAMLSKVPKLSSTWVQLEIVACLAVYLIYVYGLPQTKDMANLFIALLFLQIGSASSTSLLSSFKRNG